MTWPRASWRIAFAIGCLAAACAGSSPSEMTLEALPETTPEMTLEALPEALPGSEMTLEALPEALPEAFCGAENIGEITVVRLASQDQDALDERIRGAIDSHLIPGAVLLLGRGDGVIFQRAYGLRESRPLSEPMTLDTIFDLASLTKPLITATAVLQLAEARRLDLDAPIARYLPEFAAHEKTATIRQALLHVSGLPAVDPLSSYSGSRDANIARILALAPDARPGSRYTYSDLGFIVLGALVERVSGLSLAEYAHTRILAPLGMRDSAMGGVPGEDPRVAPTEERDGATIRNSVDDPRAYRLGGFAGNAGLFSTASDLGRFSRMMLGRGAVSGARLLSPESVAAMNHAHDLPGHHRRGLGWDMDPAHGSGLSAQAFGHGGYTGTWLYIDPARDLFIVLLTNVVHGGRAGTLGHLRRDVARIAVDALPRVAARRLEPSPPVLCGVDLIRRDGMHLLESSAASPDSSPPTPLRVGLLTHGAARTRDGLRTVDLFIDRPEVRLTRLFTPEHGLGGNREGRVRDGRYRRVPVTSLFGRRRAPTEAQLRALDVLVVDLVDVGTRYYTYPSTLLAALRVAAQAHTPVVVLDRPNPLGGDVVQGPVSSDDRPSFINSFPLPIRHGMTLGELARLFVSALSLDVHLRVIGPTGWNRAMRFEQTGLAWSPPSPNLPNARAALLYPATALVEGANVSVGRGTETPFELLGAPYLNADSLTTRLRQMDLPGVRFDAVEFTPIARPYRGQRCHGVRLTLLDADTLQAARTGFALALALHAEAPQRFDLERVAGLVADDALLEQLRIGASLEAIEASWRPGLARFRTARDVIVLEAP